MRKWLGLLCVLAIAQAQQAPAEAIDKLVERWHKGDPAERARVLADVRQLGDAALGKLLDRIARPRDFAAPVPGIAVPAARAAPAKGLAVSIELRIVRPTKLAARVVSVLSPAETAALLKEAEILTAPRLTAYDGQRANVTIGNQTAYISEFSAKGDPIIGTVSTGLVAEMEPRVSKDRKQVTLSLRCVRSELAKPIATLKTQAGEIQIPDVTKREVAVTLTLDDDGHATLALPANGSFKPLVLLVHTKVVKLERPEGGGG